MFDINTAIGHWPFRQIPSQSADALRTLLERHGITGAAVAHTHALFYKNCQDANLELAEAIAPHAGFFVGVATLNPMYAAWEKDLGTCTEEFGFRALRLTPQYHDYTLDAPEAKAIAAAAAQAGLPVLIPHRVVDTRQRHWLDTEAVNDLGQVAALARAVPDATFILTESRVSAAAMSAIGAAEGCPNLCIETSRLASAYGQELADLVRALGPGRVLFGTGAPFKEVTPARLKLIHADLTAAERAAVEGGSAREMLGIPGG